MSAKWLRYTAYLGALLTMIAGPLQETLAIVTVLLLILAELREANNKGDII